MNQLITKHVREYITGSMRKGTNRLDILPTVFHTAKAVPGYMITHHVSSGGLRGLYDVGSGTTETIRV